MPRLRKAAAIPSVASCSHRRTRTSLYIGRLAVNPSWRRRGIARGLIAHAEAEARRRGLKRLRIQVRIPLVDNQALFKSCGFLEISRENHPGYTAPTTIRMEKTL